MRKFVFGLLIVLGSAVTAEACGGGCGVQSNAFYGNSYGGCGSNVAAFAVPYAYPYTVGSTVFVNNVNPGFNNVNVNVNRGGIFRRNNVNVNVNNGFNNVNVNAGRRVRVNVR